MSVGSERVSLNLFFVHPAMTARIKKTAPHMIIFFLTQEIPFCLVLWLNLKIPTLKTAIEYKAGQNLSSKNLK